MKYDPRIVTAWFKEHGLFAAPEYRFDSDRKWRFDFILSLVPFAPYLDGGMIAIGKLALEVEGGVWSNGRHTRGSGFVKDMEKYNRAAVLGWRVLRVTPDELCMQSTVDMVKEALNG